MLRSNVTDGIDKPTYEKRLQETLETALTRMLTQFACWLKIDKGESELNHRYVYTVRQSL